jgi:tetratricopeptide (TPR) repeat protein
LAVLGLAGAAHVRAQVWRDPLTLWSDAARKAPGHPRPLVNLGMAIAAQGRFREAIELYERAAGLDPGFQEAHHNRAVALQSLGRHEEAIAGFDEALRLRPRDVFAREAIALSLLQRGDRARALEHLERAARIGADARVYFLLAQQRSFDGRLEEALHWLRVAHTRAPDHPPVLVELGLTLARLGEFEAAAQQVDRALALRDTGRARALRARIEWAAGRWASAIALAREAVVQIPDSPMAATTLAWMLLTAPDPELQKVDEAFTVIRQGVVDTSHPNVLEVRASLAAAQQQMLEAARLASDAARMARERGASSLARALEAQALGYREGRRFRESVDTARLRLTVGAWVRFPPRGSANADTPAGNSASGPANSLGDP